MMSVSHAVNEDLRAKLLEMQAEDLRTRSELERTGELFDGYAKRMEAIHVRNADALEAIIETHGWPGFSLVGPDGARAAWFVLQHSISRPGLMRKCLPLIRAASERQDVKAAYPAYLEDRIACFEGRPQRYGTQFDWDENGVLNPKPLEQAARVDEYRASVGLNPLAERTLQIRSELGNERPPENVAERQRQAAAWARSVGWR
jgi:hypothetical protein